MRIAIASDWFAPRLGGIETQLTRLAEGLGARGHAVDVLTSMPGARDGTHFQVRRLDVRTLPGLALAISPALPTSLRRELRRGYDVVHAHVSVVSPVGYAAAALARSLGMPTVVTFHSVLRAKAYLLRAVNALAGISDGPTHWTGVSNLVAAQVGRALDARVAVLPNGIDLELWRATRAPTTARNVTLVFAGRLHGKKRPRELVRAFARASHRSDVPATLLLVGDGPERRALEHDIRKLGLRGEGPGRVQMRGWLPPAALRAEYAASDAFVSAATRESFGIALLEATASGLPAIAMRAAGSSEFLAHEGNALLCDDDAQLVQALRRFIGDATLRARLAGGVVPPERYDWSVVLNEHEAAYQLATTRAARAAETVGA